MIEMDGTTNKASLGANAVLAVSISIAKASANSLRIPLHTYVAHLTDGVDPSLPLPRFNMISGGAHADRALDIQDVLVVPTGATSFAAALEEATKVHSAIADRLEARGYPRLVADEGGWAPPLESNETAIAWVADAIETANVEAVIALDLAASQFYDEDAGVYRLALDKQEVVAAGLAQLIEEWVAKYPIVSLEDPLAEDDWVAWSQLTKILGATVEVVGDDLFATDIGRLRKGVHLQAANAILIKPNQVGTITETIEVIRRAKESGFATIVSARSGDTEDPFIADVAVGTGAGQIKVGSITGSSRTSKWNQLLRIEGETGSPQYLGRAALRQATSHRNTLS
jgi:enolase 1/2/3